MPKGTTPITGKVWPCPCRRGTRPRTKLAAAMRRVLSLCRSSSLSSATPTSPAIRPCRLPRGRGSPCRRRTPSLSLDPSETAKEDPEAPHLRRDGPVKLVDVDARDAEGDELPREEAGQVVGRQSRLRRQRGARGWESSLSGGLRRGDPDDGFPEEEVGPNVVGGDED